MPRNQLLTQLKVQLVWAKINETLNPALPDLFLGCFCAIICKKKGCEMTKQEAFMSGVGAIKGTGVAMTQQQEEQYMSSMDNWVLVHATKYMPLKNAKGQLYIPTTAMATNFEIPRATVHFTLNHIVGNHGINSWDNADIVILMPFNKTRNLNGGPAEVALCDTYFCPRADQGMILPDGAHIIRPANDLPDGKLFEVRGNETVYKSFDFTDAEIKKLIPQLGYWDKQTYDKYIAGDFEDYEIEMIVSGLGEVGKRFYENSKDKKAFLRGLFENSAQSILGLRVRQMAFEETVRSMGGRVAQYVADLGETSQVVAKVAGDSGMLGNISNKGHSCSVYADVETLWHDHYAIMNDDWFFGEGFTALLKKENPLEQIYLYINKRTDSGKGMAAYVNALLTGAPVGLAQDVRAILDEHNVKDNPNLQSVLDKWVTRAEKEFVQFHEKIKALPDYALFIEKLRKMPTFEMRQQMKNKDVQNSF